MAPYGALGPSIACATAEPRRDFSECCQAPDIASPIPTDDLRATHLTRRFGILPTHARIVAELAFRAVRS